MDKSTKTKPRSKTKSDGTSSSKSNGSEAGGSTKEAAQKDAPLSPTSSKEEVPEKSAIEMVEEATGSKRSSSRKTKDLKTSGKSTSSHVKQSSGDSSSATHAKPVREASDGKESMKEKKEKRKSKKPDAELTSAEMIAVATSTPLKDVGGSSPRSETTASTPESSGRKVRPKSMMISSPKEILEGSSEAPKKGTTHDKKKGSKHMSSAPNAREDSTSERPVASPSKLRGPSRESSRSDLETLTSGNSSPASRRKSVGASSRLSTVIKPSSPSITPSSSSIDTSASNTGATATTTTETKGSKDSSDPNASEKPSITKDSSSTTSITSAATATSASGANGVSSDKTSSSHSTTTSTSASSRPSGGVGPLSSASNDSIENARSTSKVGEVRAMWEQKSQSTRLEREISPRQAGSITSSTSSGSVSTTKEPPSPNSISNGERKPLATIPSVAEDNESNSAAATGSSSGASAPAPRSGKIATTSSSKPTSTGRTTSGSSLVSSSNALALSAETSPPSDNPEVNELRAQYSSLKSVTTELTARLDALSIKVSFTLENIGRRLDSMDVQIKKLQTDVVEMAVANSAARATAAANGNRGSVDLTGSGLLMAPGDPSSPSGRTAPRRGISQKDLGARRTNSVTQMVKPAPSSTNLLPGGASSPSAQKSSSSSSSSESMKDSRSFLTTHLIDLATLKKPITVPLLLQQPESMEKRARVACEILESEIRYLFGVELMIKNWESPLLAYAAKEPKLEVNEVSKIFGEGWLQPMLDNNTTQLCAPLEERLGRWTDDSTIGDIFLKFERGLHQYKRYCGSYEQSLRLLISLADNNSKFKKALQFFDNHCVAFNGLRLRDYLITPVQRVPRYNLLLRDLLACTPESHPDFPLLTDAVAKVSDVATEINSHIRQAESQWKMAEIVGRGNGFEQLLSKNATRSFVKSFTVDVLVDLMDRRRNVPNRKQELLIFNDLVVAGTFVNKKATPQDFSIPTALTWVITDLTESPENLTPLLEDVPRSNAFLLRGPESLWLIGAKHQAEFTTLLEVLQNTIGCPQSELADGPRSGSYSFQRIPGRYTGQWRDADFHGEGTYTKADGSLFQGHWDCRFKTGYGTIVVAGSPSHIGGWKNMRPDNDVVEYKDHQLWSDSDLKELSEREWKLLMTRAKVVEYKQDQKVVQQDVSNSSLYKIKSGKCRVEKTTHEGKRLTLVTLSEGAYFGDTSVLPMMSKATADVICDTPTAEIAVIEVSVLLELLKNDPVLAMRFFRQLANTLANRLKSFHAAPAPGGATSPQNSSGTLPPSPSPSSTSLAVPSSSAGSSSKSNDKRKRSESSGDLSVGSKGGSSAADDGDEDVKAQTDQDYVHKFDLPSGEVLITTMTATMKGVMKKYAQLYLSQRFLCFEAKVFVTSRDVIPLDRVTKLELVKKKYIAVSTKKSKFEFSVDNLEELYSLLSSLSVGGSSASSNAKDHDSTDLHHKEGSRLSLTAEKSSDDTQTASSEGDAATRERTGSNAGWATGPKRRSTTMNLALDDSVDASGGLTAADWSVLQQGFQCISYTKGMAIIQQGQSQTRLFQIARGSCRIEIKNEKEAQPKVVGNLTTRDMFGEISFLYQGSAATASVVADDETVEVYVLDGYFINILFVKYPDLAGRFFAYIAGVIAGRLNEREASKVSQERKHRRTRTKANLPTSPAPAGASASAGGSSPSKTELAPPSIITTSPPR